MMSAAPTLETANEARRGADTYRAQWLMLVHEGMVTPGDVLTDAAGTQARPLLKLTLRQLLLAQPGWGRTRAYAIIDKVLSVADASIDRRQVTIGWLLDPRAGGRRFAAWLDAIDPRKELSAPGFPHAKKEQ
ncbi:hypothetical protein IV500_04640 [Paeniglutamicibacter antarcticus]|uniref:Uncharacterized protein n=1 Tax=Arthrobacter terrae TaxID=2935737 RepID=A0A931CLJ9_9MICC|nr:hypothetical protein [Arthrobacter terrae]MBG0738705.1 hypothetical protein [Arthrobacter terrae]